MSTNITTNITAPESLVSVIILTYNRPEYLKKAIASAVRQTYRNIEIIVSDDCSPDNPQAIIDEFQDPRIRLRRNPQNLGIALNVTSAFREAKGKYVASLNDDDLWNEDYLAKLVPYLDANPDLVVAFCDHYVIDSEDKIDYLRTEENTRYWQRSRLKEGIYQPFYELSVVDQSVFIALATVIRRDAIDWDSIPLEVGLFWDLYLAYLACRSGKGAYYYPERLTRYRIHPQSETQISGKKNVQAKIRTGKAGIFCYEQFISDKRLQQFRPYFRAKLAQSHTTLGIGLMRSGQIAAARPHFWKAIQYQLNLRSVAALTLSFTPGSIVKLLKV
ncbi:glycosyltransferase family 2 protein [Chroococcidiopsis sp. FACHB-1243]|uniref:glycosyltransferase family 2 protein n=1 Tax=Chroococcidiopsis sp. [FACHB-1243] TaxID=2692781 RepID=UPI0017859E29|nr:glycosyltransferase family 2 protein [Chroococcidiopsis sp. [FACHB-1243]]MBD2306539.1 glycosyltransferase family 2 protein [Chroococcidiopsis sp. [FACHB-1243]]